ncbi:PE family protein [Mycobacterium helveticum]|uniref:PE-PPE domain-containing protein n=1 Tax=Mycobacterium helveticum TaxID=2592811 RepID=A0A557Y1P7_9MYCO|nr:PE-PPE domain-containing protein [Mycobacterium helveticum]TVS89299.1 PE-PPE domain-containing protein [Mycobacterium helveticum]TVS92515.1 PE-PPE domain-containing protein [Mycobacterium helveticum]
MTSMLVQPQLMATAASDAAGIGSAIEQARSAAAAPTTGLVAAAEDEVSAATAALFGSFGQEYQAMLAQATAYHDQFVAALSGASTTYAQAEASVAGMLGLGSAASTTSSFGTPYTPTPTNVIAQLIMTGSGTATPSLTYMNNVTSRYLTEFTSGVNQAVSTPEGLYPFTGVKDLTLNISLARGITQLDNAIKAALPVSHTNSALSILGYSQSSTLASMAMPILHDMGYTSSQLNFTLLGDPSAPNGGLLARFPDLSLPSLGITFGNSTPSDLFNTTIYSLEYDGFADFPQYPIDFLADLNALAGIVFIHGTYPTLSTSQIASGFLLPGSAQLNTPGGSSLTNYVMIPTQNLPLLDPLRAIPVIGNPLADLVQPDLRYLINWGYGNPEYGYSTGLANVQTPFGFLPPLSATTSLGPLLVSGAQQGMAAFGADISAMLPTSLPAMALPNLSVPDIAGTLAGGGSSGTTALALPSVSSIPATLTNLIGGIENANNAIVGGFTTDFSTAYATLLPTADIATAVVVSLPSYDLNLFLNGITQAINGNPMGLVNAIGDPIAADTGLVTLAGGFELINFENALQTILLGVPNPGPY